METTSYSYVYNGGQLSQMTVTTVTETADGQTTTETHTVDLTYDASGNPQTMTYDGVTYYYTVNIQGDVSGIVDENGNVLVRYNYQATYYYDVPINSVGPTLRQINPLTYRGYVYDKETKLYYLQSRYYNRTSGRFINADSLVTTGQGLLGNNMFAYCGNNPVMQADPTGNYSEPLPVYFDDPGNSYIIDQHESPIGNMRFGIVNVAHGGCGIVASYNALVSMGRRKPFHEVLAYYNKNSSDALLWGVAGMTPDLVVAFFQEQGYNVIVTDDIDMMDVLSRKADAAILWYLFTSDRFPGFGGHFVEYSRATSGYIGRNTNERVSYFNTPSEYGYRGKRFYAVGIFIFK